MVTVHPNSMMNPDHRFDENKQYVSWTNCTSNPAWIGVIRGGCMQRPLFRVLFGVSVWLVLGGLSANAQVIKKLTMQVPFDFNVRAHHYPAGTYSVLREGPFLSFRDNNGRVLEQLLANRADTQTVPVKSKFVFFDCQGTHFLSRIVWQGERNAAEFLPAGREQELARRFVPEAVTSAQVGGRP
jgi:hypothetical protein